MGGGGLGGMIGAATGMVGSAIGGIAGGLGVGGAQAAPVNLQTPVTNTMFQQDRLNALRGMTQQQNFVNALRRQNGIGNQSNVFNQLSGIASGQGPNPAQAMLNQQTAGNIANQAALLASQRGASSNVGLMGRQAAMAGSQAQQQAIGQAATMQANQSLNALNSMGNLATQQVSQQSNALGNLNNLRQNQQNMTMSGIANQNNARLGESGQQTQVNMANQQSRDAFLGNVMSAGGAAMAASDEKLKKNVKEFDSKTFLDKINPAEYKYKDEKFGKGNQVGVMAQDLEKTQAGEQLVVNTPEGKMVDYNKAGGPILASLADINKRLKNLEGVKMNMGGPVPMNGQVGLDQIAPIIPVQEFSGPKSIYGQEWGKEAGKGIGTMMKSSGSSSGGASSVAPIPSGGGGGAGFTMSAGFNQGGMVNALVSPGEVYLNKSQADLVKQGKMHPLQGVKIPGQPKVKGTKDTPKNDTVPTKLESGGIVLPRSVTQAKDAEKKAINFVKKVFEKK